MHLTSSHQPTMDFNQVKTFCRILSPNKMITKNYYFQITRGPTLSQEDSLVEKMSIIYTRESHSEIPWRILSVHTTWPWSTSRKPATCFWVKSEKIIDEFKDSKNFHCSLLFHPARGHMAAKADFIFGNEVKCFPSSSASAKNIRMKLKMIFSFSFQLFYFIFPASSNLLLHQHDASSEPCFIFIFPKTISDEIIKAYDLF